MIPWTDKLFWPAAIGSALGILIAAAASFGINEAVGIVPHAKNALGIFATFQFFLLLFDADSRRSIETYNQIAKNHRNLSWSDWLFPPEIHRRLMALALLAWVQILLLSLAGERKLALLPGFSFFVTGLMAMLLLKKIAQTASVQECTDRKPRRGVGFWIGGDGGD